MNKMILSSLLAVLLLPACTQQEETPPNDDWEGTVCFTSRIGAAASRATASQFEEEDSVSIFAFTDDSGFASESYAANKKYVYRTDRFMPSNKSNAISYPENANPLTFHAIYPYCATAAASFLFNVKEDQLVGRNYTLSDLMTASTVSTTEETPSLQFAHRLANIEINLSFAEVPAGAINVSIQNVTTTASVDMATGSFKGSGEQTKQVKAATNGTNSYKAILPPQAIQAGTAWVVISTQTGDMTWEMPKATAWKPGFRYAYALTINKEGEVTFTSTINPWEEDSGDSGTFNKNLLYGRWEMTHSEGQDEEVSGTFYTFYKDGTGLMTYKDAEANSCFDYYYWSLKKNALKITVYRGLIGKVDKESIYRLKELTSTTMVMSNYSFTKR